MEKRPSPVRWSLMLALVVLFGLTVALGGAASASSSVGPMASTAKKCKKSKKSAVAAKKKCKKGGATTPLPTIAPPTPPSSPAPPPRTTRATLTWTGDADLDLYVWDTSGNVANGFDNEISGSQHSPDSGTGGTESFTDLLSPSNRKFSFGVCEFDDPTPSTTSYTISGTSSTGVPFSFSLSDMTAAGDWDSFGEAGSFDPGDGADWCQIGM